MGRNGVKRRLDLDDSQPVRRSARLAGLPPISTATIEQRSHSPTIPPTSLLEPPDLSPSPSISAIEFQARVNVSPLGRFRGMRLAVAPPQGVVAGVALTAPVLLTFEASNADKERHEDDDESIVDFSNCWAFLSLVAEDGKESLAPPRKDLLEGDILDSVHEVDDGEEGNAGVIGYAAFKNLKILKPGRYCFGIKLVDMTKLVQTHLHQIGQVDLIRGSTMSSNEARISQVVHSDIFDVVDEEGHVPATRSRIAPARLEEIGAEIA